MRSHNKELMESLVGEIDAQLRERIGLARAVEVLKPKDVKDPHTAVHGTLWLGDRLIDALDAPAKGQRVHVHAEGGERARSLGDTQLLLVGIRVRVRLRLGQLCSCSLGLG